MYPKIQLPQKWGEEISNFFQRNKITKMNKYVLDRVIISEKQIKKMKNHLTAERLAVTKINISKCW